MTTYIATFFDHYGAVSFSRELRRKGVSAELMPVPRSLSSSCGTCVEFAAEEPAAYMTEDVDGLYARTGADGYAPVSL